jgi:hypothetical protein
LRGSSTISRCRLPRRDRTRTRPNRVLRTETISNPCARADGSYGPGGGIVLGHGRAAARTAALAEIRNLRREGSFEVLSRRPRRPQADGVKGSAERRTISRHHRRRHRRHRHRRHRHHHRHRHRHRHRRHRRHHHHHRHIVIVIVIVVVIVVVVIVVGEVAGAVGIGVIGLVIIVDVGAEQVALRIVVEVTLEPSRPPP